MFDERDAWSEHQPSSQQENDFIERHGFEEYGKWHSGIDHEKPEDTKGRYEFPYGDFNNVHRCGVISAESRAGQYKHFDIEKAAHHLHEMIDARADKGAAKTARCPAQQIRVASPGALSGEAFRNTLKRSRRRSGVLGQFREIDAASPKAMRCCSQQTLHGEDHRLDRCAFLEQPIRRQLRAAVEHHCSAQPAAQTYVVTPCMLTGEPIDLAN